MKSQQKISAQNDESQPEPYHYYGENSDEDSDPYGYRAELLGQHFSSSDDDY